MESTTCDYCALPFKVRRVTAGQPKFCCTGCALASRIPVNDQGEFPVNAALISALATGFIFFNQLLFWGLASLLKRQADAALAERMLWLASGAAWVLWLMVVGLMLRAKAGRLGDGVLVVGVLAVHALAHRQLPPEPIGMAAASAALLLWSARGLLRGKFRSR